MATPLPMKCSRCRSGGRLDESGEPFYFYFQSSVYRYFPAVVPLALATLIALRHRWSERFANDDVQMVVRLGACGLMILLGLSVPHFKRAYYILPHGADVRRCRRLWAAPGARLAVWRAPVLRMACRGATGVCAWL